MAAIARQVRTIHSTARYCLQPHLGRFLSTLPTFAVDENTVRFPFATATATAAVTATVEAAASVMAGVARDRMSNGNGNKTLNVDIEDLHAEAVARGASSYIDPETGFTCFTEIQHLKRGVCCGSQCRHCPYGWDAVSGMSRPAAIRSGDFDASQRRLQDLLGGRYKPIVPRVTKATAKLAAQASSAAKRQLTLRAREDENVIISKSSDKTSNREVQVQTEQAEGGEPGTVDGSADGDAVPNAISAASKSQSDQKHFQTIKKASTDKNVPYTRTGDKGTSQLGNGERRPKCDCNFEALGTVDELCSQVGVVHAQIENDGFDYGHLPDCLLDVMSRLFDIGTHVAKPHPPGRPFHPDGVGGGLDPTHIDELESWIDQMTDELPELLSFILPTGAPAAAQLHVARTVCRRCERHLVPLGDTCDPNCLRYANRLSDFFFTAARYVNMRQGRDEICYKKPGASATHRERVTQTLQAAASNGAEQDHTITSQH